ncbi:growth-arrest-specific micro-tubule binding-domain-containing protein [Tribonema minus]|uniref:Growth-arrest-specific micro-tubule binding-domain-containing protein n=1 Tax=Tribonema minus TaxID=303371 RepID=A0A835YLL1_9STRA|nr:growth-arrest-specific micro-tubule binding-domain-containing protein [Tribonema minus]
MPAKKKKAGGKGKAKKEEAAVVEETEYDNMDLEMLHEVVPMLKQQLEKSMLDRNYVQLERDTIQTFYDISRREARDLGMNIAAKDREMELMEDNHRVEVRVYMQKVKHLEYEHRNNLRAVEAEGASLLGDESAQHGERDADLKCAKHDLKRSLAERELLNAEEISQVKAAHLKNLTKMREGFDGSLAELRERCEARLAQLEMDLELRRKVDVHEIEERKNLHINDLIRNHESAFGQMKTYYNDITNDNLRLIRSLKDELVEMKKKAVANQRLMADIGEENKRLTEPLLAAVAEVGDLRARLRDQEKDRLSLANARARLRKYEQELEELGEAYAEAQREFEATEGERDELYESFEGAVRGVQQRSDFRNLMLERKVSALEAGIERSGARLGEAAAAAGLAPDDVARVAGALDAALAARARGVGDLRAELLRASKAYDDALRTCARRLEAAGVPRGEAAALGFAPAACATATGPAGLVVAVAAR